jgi:hypothetical protein
LPAILHRLRQRLGVEHHPSGGVAVFDVDGQLGRRSRPEGRSPPSP